MKLHPDKFNIPVISGYGPGWISLDGEKISSSLIIGSRGERLAWNCARFELLGSGHFAQLAEFGPELILFGSGEQQRFPLPAWLGALSARRIGVESMTTTAACRTYNILAGEGRHVLAALLVETP